jgi:hypothetical protein
MVSEYLGKPDEYNRKLKAILLREIEDAYTYNMRFHMKSNRAFREYYQYNGKRRPMQIFNYYISQKALEKIHIEYPLLKFSHPQGPTNFWLF